jgi:protein-tyrosine phosphatase
VTISTCLALAVSIAAIAPDAGLFAEVARPPSEIVHGRLWQGGAPVDFAWVRRTGITVVLDVSNPEIYPAPKDFEGLDYIKMPLEDTNRLPDLAILDGVVQAVANAYRGGRKILVHCRMGLNRSGFVDALVLRALFNLTGAEAMKTVQARREGSLVNAVFAAHLRTLPRPRPAEPAQAVP